MAYAGRGEYYRTEIMKYIEFFISAYGKAPTVREIGKHIGIRSTSHVLYHLRGLQKMGYIRMRTIYAKMPNPAAKNYDNHGGRGIYLTKKRMFI